ncbi:MAG TPA: nucleoside triphosphate pyrophosphohydrolase [Chromatiales bacterium]|nr:nucleoside triphosphate pyrophosphohydrolase [Chromatiales bacterium]
MSNINKLLEVMTRLRDPESGCPWDLEQDFRSIAPYTIEEAYEVADAADHNDLEALRSELGDLLLQVVFHAQIAAESGAFDFDSVVAGITAKMIRRHPHVFGNDLIDNAQAQTEAWEQHKEAERRSGGEHGVLDGVSLALPALLRAQKLGKRAARVGFDWPDVSGPREKILEELDEIDAAIQSDDPAAIADEVGDLLFAVANLARKLGVNPEEALRQSNRKFERRFRDVEAKVAEQGGDWNRFSLDELEALWASAKQKR